MTRRCKSLLVVLLLIGCAVVCVDCNADRMILGENHDRIDPGLARREMLRVEGRAVEYWIARSPAAKSREPEAFVLYFIGKGGRSDQWIEKIADSWDSRAVEVWGMNYPGSGGSDGPVRMAQVGTNGLAVYDAAEAVAGSRPIFIQGGSFGTTVALSVAARRPVAGVILQNPPPLRQLIVGQYGWWNLWLAAGPIAAQVPDDLDSVVNASHCTAPAVFILAGNDQLIPPKYHDMVVNAYAGPKRIINMPRAGHDDPLTHEAAEELGAAKEGLFSTLNTLSAPQTRPAQ